MGNCFSDTSGGRMAVNGATSSEDYNNHSHQKHHHHQSQAASDGGNDALDLFLRSRGYYGLYSRIQLSLSASSLSDRDVLSKSDPMAVVYIKRGDGTLEELGRTEVVLNSLNPMWIVKVNVTYHFEVMQSLVFRVYDVDTQFHNVDVKMLKLDEQQSLGEASCALSEIVTKSSRSFTLDLVRHDLSAGSKPLHSLGKLTVHAEESISSKITTELVVKCTELENKDVFSKSDPFLVISKIVESGISIPVCKTEVIKNDLNPTWKPVSLNIQQVGSKDSPLIFECFNFNGNGKHDVLGNVQKSLLDLERLNSSGEGENLFLPPPVGHDKPKVLKSKIFVERFTESVQYTFLDYLAAGCELNFMVAVDFTASNGNPRFPDSLHYIDPSGRPNAYQKAILDVGGVLQFYDSDRRFPAWGFGARPIDGPVSHCFNLNGSSNYCEVDGIQGIMTAYMSALMNVSLAGPTLFGHVITAAATIASQSLAEGRQKYFVLLIITDGVITDLQETKDAIVKASDLPLSILIVGVGGADFKEMEVLDADKGDRLESTTGRLSSRDIVQFVPFRDVQRELNLSDDIFNPIVNECRLIILCCSSLWMMSIIFGYSTRGFLDACVPSSLSQHRSSEQRHCEVNANDLVVILPVEKSGV
ncbi:BONZAI 1-like protein [Drosera capensis]